MQCSIAPAFRQLCTGKNRGNRANLTENTKKALISLEGVVYPTP
jgi:hypothetical protein